MVEFHTDGFGSFGGLIFDMVPADVSDVLIVGIPYESATSGKKGAAFAPVELRKLSVDMQTMSREGTDLNQMVLKDMGNVVVYPVEGKETRDSIERSYDELFAQGPPVITLGGDHSCTFPILKSLAKEGSVGVIWFDAHRDLLSELMGSRWSHGSPLRRALELENISAEHVLLVGTRYMEPSEEEFVAGLPIKELRMVDLERNGFDLPAFSSMVANIAENVDHLYVSIDIDVLDPAHAPATGTPVGGGMTTAQLMQMVKSIPAKVRAFDLMEVSPPHDHGEITVKAALGIVTEILAQIKNSNLS